MTTAPQSAQAPVLLSIAGFDPSSGAGITADLAAFAAHGFFGTSAITVMTVQSTQGVAAVQELSPALLEHTLMYLAADIPPAGIKIGALGSRKLIEKVFLFLQSFPAIPVVLDPVLISSSGRYLLQPDDIESLHEGLLTRITWLTPNWNELALLTRRKVSGRREAELAAAALSERHSHLNLIATGGDQDTPADFLQTPDGRRLWLEGEHVSSRSTHGTGCAFSSALLSRLVQRHEPFEAVRLAKQYVEEGIRRAPGIGGGKGPLDLLWPLS